VTGQPAAPAANNVPVPAGTPANGLVPASATANVPPAATPATAPADKGKESKGWFRNPFRRD
jgi:hypothetical protein